MNCPNCGVELTDGSSWCSSCGFTINDQQYQQSMPEMNYNGQYQQPMPEMNYNGQYQQPMPEMNYNGQYQQPVKKKKTGLIIGIIIGILVLAGGGVAAWFLLGNRTDGTYVCGDYESSGIKLSIDVEEDAATVKYDKNGDTATYEGNITIEKEDVLLSIDGVNYVGSYDKKSKELSFVDLYKLFPVGYDGTYELSEVSAFGMTYTTEQFEEISGYKIDMTITVEGSECTLSADMSGMGVEGSDSAKITFSGDTVTIEDGSQTLTGKYDSSAKTITLTSQGVDMVFEMTSGDDSVLQYQIITFGKEK